MPPRDEKEQTAQGGEGTPGLRRERAEPCSPLRALGSTCAKDEVSGW